MLLARPLLLDRLLHLHQQFAELLVHVADLLGQLGEINLEIGHRPERLENRQCRFREGNLREDMRHLTQKAGSAQAVFGGHAQEHAIETANMAVFDRRQSMVLELDQEFVVGGGDKDARRAGGMHLRRQGGERVNPFHPEGLGELDEPVTENVSPHRAAGLRR